jgi:hypothetical protein
MCEECRSIIAALKAAGEEKDGVIKYLATKLVEADNEALRQSIAVSDLVKKYRL